MTPDFMRQKTYWIAAAAVTTALACAPAAFANSAAATHFSTKSLNSNSSSITHTVPRGVTVSDRYIKGSDTANYYYKVGVSKFEKGNLDAAERAFKAVLRAHGSRKEAHHYLALIRGKKGDMDGAAKHVQAYKAAQ